MSLSDPERARDLARSEAGMHSNVVLGRIGVPVKFRAVSSTDPALPKTQQHLAVSGVRSPFGVASNEDAG